MGDKSVVAFVALWVTFALLYLGFLGVILWAIIRLVLHFT